MDVRGAILPESMDTFLGILSKNLTEFKVRFWHIERSVGVDKALSTNESQDTQDSFNFSIHEKSGVLTHINYSNGMFEVP